MFQSGLTHGGGERETFMSAPRDARQQSFLPVAGRKRLQKTLDCILLLPRQGKCIQHHGSADGDDRRELAQDGAVSGQQQQRFGGAKLRKGRSSGLEFSHATQRDFSNRF